MRHWAMVIIYYMQNELKLPYIVPSQIDGPNDEYFIPHAK